MPLTGLVDFVGTIGHSTPGGMFSLIGVDAKHYVVPTTITAPAYIAAVGCAETNTVTYTRTEAEWRTDLAALGMGTSGTYNYSAVVPAAGTPYFFIVGGGSVSAANESHNVGVRYKIVSTSSVVVDGGFANVRSAGGGLLFRGGSVGEVFGAGVISGALYAVHLLDNPGVWLRNYLVKYDLTGTDANLTVGSWEDRVTYVSAWDAGFFISSTARQYYDRASLINLGSGLVGIMSYVGQGEINSNGGSSTTIAGLSQASVLFASLDPVLHTCTASSDISSIFGVPLADAGLNYASAAGSARDDYTSPSITPAGEVTFARSFSDNRQYARLRRFQFIDSGHATNLGQTTFQFTSEISFSSDLEFVQTYREGDDVLVTARDTRHFFFGQITLALPAIGWIPKVRHI